MKANPKRLARLFFEVGMLDAEAFERCEEKLGRETHSLMETLRSDVSMQTLRELTDASMRSLRDLMMTEIDLSAVTGRNSEDKRKSSLRDALSQPLHVTNDEIRHILNAWRPPLHELARSVAAADDSISSPVEIVGRVGRDTENAYDQLVQRGHLDGETVLRLATSQQLPQRRFNRLLLALSLLQFNDVLLQSDCEEIIDRFRGEGAARIPNLNEEVIRFVDSQPDVPRVDLEDQRPSEDLLQSFPLSFIQQNTLLPLRRRDGILEIATPDPLYAILPDALSLITGHAVLPIHAPDSEIVAQTLHLFPRARGEKREIPTVRVAARPSPASDGTAQEERPEAPDSMPGESAEAASASRDPKAVVSAVAEMTDSGSAVELVSTIIDSAVRQRATDIHLEPRESGLVVRYRVDGRLRVVTTIAPSLRVSVTSRTKVLAGLDVTERRRPQDGHFSHRFEDNHFDFRVSTLPTHVGEKIVIRILDARRVMHALSELGMSDEQCEMLRGWIKRPYGLVLVTGPTGAGKTSTLYAALNTINSEEKNIVTIEDPVEYRLQAINQVQVAANYDLGFATGLRATLRQDPDVIMVGEIRDHETARIAVRASLTGHLVLSTLHANTAPGVIATLDQMDLESYMITSAVSGVINQRLVRLLCESCRESCEPEAPLLRGLGLEPEQVSDLFRAKGCAQCFSTGYWGRTGIYELMPVNEDVAHSILNGGDSAEIARVARKYGYRTLREHGAKKVAAGLTSAEEVLENVLVDEPV